MRAGASLPLLLWSVSFALACGDEHAAPRVARVGADRCPAGPWSDPLPPEPRPEKLSSVAEDDDFNLEGVVWVEGALYFSGIRGNGSVRPTQIDRLVPGEELERGVIANTGSNGLALDARGNLIAATHDVGAISAFDLASGARSAVGAQTFGGLRFNSPNDLVLRGDGNVYFTDPPFHGARQRAGGDAGVSADSDGGRERRRWQPDQPQWHHALAGRRLAVRQRRGQPGALRARRRRGSGRRLGRLVAPSGARCSSARCPGARAAESMPWS